MRRPAVYTIATVSALTLAGCAWTRPSPGVVTLRCSHWGMIQEARVWQDLARRFNAKNPKLQIKLEHIAGQNYHSKVLAMTVARNAPDLLCADDEQFRELASNGLYEDLTPFLERDSPRQVSEFYPQLWESFRIDGRMYAIPYVGISMLIYYNRDHRKAAGLSPDPDPNWTWDDFVRDAKAVTRDLDGDGKTDQFAFPWNSYFYCLQWIWAAGGVDMDPGMTRYVFDSPEARAGFQFHYDHLHKHRICPRMTDLPNMNVEAMFLTGRVSMVFGGAWWIVQAKQAKGFEWDVAHMPIGPKRRATRVTTEGIAISRLSKHKEEAWEWIKFLVSDEAQEVISRAGRGLPAIREIAPKSWPNPKTPQHEERFMEAMAYAQRSSLHKNFIATNYVFDREWDRVRAGELDIQGFLEAALPEANAIIRGDAL